MSPDSEDYTLHQHVLHVDDDSGITRFTSPDLVQISEGHDEIQLNPTGRHK
jgi:hypothetical protein